MKERQLRKLTEKHSGQYYKAYIDEFPVTGIIWKPVSSVRRCYLMNSARKGDPFHWQDESLPKGFTHAYGIWTGEWLVNHDVKSLSIITEEEYLSIKDTFKPILKGKIFSWDIFQLPTGIYSFGCGEVKLTEEEIRTFVTSYEQVAAKGNPFLMIMEKLQDERRELDMSEIRKVKKIFNIK